MHNAIMRSVMVRVPPKKLRPDTRDIRLVVNKIVRVVAVVFDAVQPQQTHPVRQLLVGNGVLLASIPVSGLQFKDGFLQRTRVAGDGLHQPRQPGGWRRSARTPSAASPWGPSSHRRQGSHPDSAQTSFALRLRDRQGEEITRRFHLRAADGLHCPA